MVAESLRVRARTAADADRLTPLINAAFAVETFLNGPRTDPERLLAAIEKGVILLAGEACGELTALVCAELRGDRPYAGMLAVDPGRTEVGAGRTDAGGRSVSATAWVRGVDVTVLSLRPELPGLDRKLGFVETAHSRLCMRIRSRAGASATALCDVESA